MQRRLLRLLGEHSPDLQMSAGLATRSTLGPCTITLRPVGGDGEVDLDAIAAWLGRQPGVDLVAAKRSHLHVRLQIDALRVWFCDGWGETAPAPGGELKPVSVAIPEATAPCSLGCSRKASVAHSVVALLEEQGRAVEVTASADEHVWLRDPEDQAEPGGPLQIEVAEVDTRHDRLRARHGGTVTLENLLADIREDAIALEGRKRSDLFAETLVSYLMTHVPRERRLGVDNETVRQKLTELDEIQAARAMAKERCGADATVMRELSAQAEAKVRTLIGLVESGAAVRARARSSLDPAPVNRLLRLLAGGMQAAESDLPEGDPLWAASAETLESGLRLLAAPRAHQVSSP